MKVGLIKVEKKYLRRTFYGVQAIHWRHGWCKHLSMCKNGKVAVKCDETKTTEKNLTKIARSSIEWLGYHSNDRNLSNWSSGPPLLLSKLPSISLILMT